MENSTRHNFGYGASRTGKTTIAAQAAKAGHRVLAVTMEPGVTQAAFAAEGAEVTIFTPPTPEALYVFLDYPTAYLAKHFGGFEPTLALFDNLAGLQGLIIGRPAEMKQTVEGVDTPARAATGIVGNIPKGRGEASNPEALSQAQYGVLGRHSRRLLTAIDNLPFHTLVTSIEQLDYDEKYKKDSQGLPAQQAAGRPRKVKGYPRTEGAMTKMDLPSLVSGAFLHLTHEEDNYIIHSRSHEDKQGIEWFADPRGMRDAPAQINWTGKSIVEMLFPLTPSAA